jgi:hypothetical protein
MASGNIWRPGGFCYRPQRRRHSRAHPQYRSWRPVLSKPVYRENLARPVSGAIYSEHSRHCVSRCRARIVRSPRGADGRHVQTKRKMRTTTYGLTWPPVSLPRGETHKGGPVRLCRWLNPRPGFLDVKSTQRSRNPLEANFSALFGYCGLCHQV